MFDKNSVFYKCFDTARANLPYESGREHLKDWMTVIDLLLDLHIVRNHAKQNEQPQDAPGTYVDKNSDKGSEQNEDSQNILPKDEGEMHALFCMVLDHILQREEVTIDGYYPLLLLRKRFSLSLFDMLCVLLCTASSLSRRYEDVFQYIQGNGNRTQPTRGLCIELYTQFLDREKEELDSFPDLEARIGRVLFSHNCNNGASRVCSMLFPNRVLNKILQGEFDILDRDAPAELFFAETLLNEEPVINGDIVRYLVDFVECFADQNGLERCIVSMDGPSGCGKKFVLKCVAAECGLNLLFIHCEKLLQFSKQEIEIQLYDFVLQSLAVDSIPVLADLSVKTQDIGLVEWVLSIMKRYFNVLFITTAEENISAVLNEPNVLRVPFSRNSASERRCLWEYFMAEYEAEKTLNITKFANKYNYTAGQIKQILERASMEALVHRHGKLAEEHIGKAIRLQNTAMVQSSKITYVESIFGWDDIILQNEQRKLMRDACNRILNIHIVNDEWKFNKKLPYGRGISILLYGPPGTGKTMAAQVIANEIGLDLYKVDLSQLTSKYIGETEKNLSEIFAFSQNTNCILFFDEADALFSKRTEVKDSHDRNANTETAYLLQRIEEHSGLSILSTNYFNNIDPAFRRRFTYIISMPKPDAAMRRQLWESVFPKEAPLAEGLDFENLAAKLELTGSSIKSIAVDAAYRAAALNSAITYEHIIQALSIEMLKIGSPITQRELVDLR